MAFDEAPARRLDLPDDVWEAVAQEASRNGLTSSEWIGLQIHVALRDREFPVVRQSTITAPLVFSRHDPDDERAEHYAALERLESAGLQPERFKMLEPVTACSDALHRRAVWTLAGYVSWELHLDGVPYPYAGEKVPIHLRAYLWVDRGAAVGACCFLPFAPKSDDGQWSLEWVWMHPYARRKGLLLSAWPFFRERFGEFVIQPPLSSAMRGFLGRMQSDSNN
jgi:hypothetical protein